jgi:hypothetical protein
VTRHLDKRDALLAQPGYQDMRAQLLATSTLPPQEEALLKDLGLEDLGLAPGATE